MEGRKEGISKEERKDTKGREDGRDISMEGRKEERKEGHQRKGGRKEDIKGRKDGSRE